MLDSGSGGWFAEIDPLRDGIESYGGVDVGVAAESVDVDSDSSSSMNEVLVHHNLGGLVSGHNTCNGVEEFITPDDLISSVVDTGTEVETDVILTLTVGNGTNDLTCNTIGKEGRVDRDVMDDRVLRKTEERGSE